MLFYLRICRHSSSLGDWVLAKKKIVERKKEMKSFVRVLLVVVLALLVATPLVAQELPAGDARNSQFRVHMTEIVRENPQVSDFHRMRVGTEYLLPSGYIEILQKGDKNGIWGREFQKTYGVSYEKYLEDKAVPTPEPTSVPTVISTFVPAPVTELPIDEDRWFWFAVLVFASLVMLFVAWWVLRDKEERKNPTTSGPAVVPGGITSAEPARLESYFQDQATSQVAAGTPPPVRVSPIEEGMISGRGMVGYADHARRHRINPAQPGYRATFRFADGSERVLMSLQGCMNPCFAGQGMSGFTFVPGRVVVPVPVAAAPVSLEPTSTPVTPVVTPTTVVPTPVALVPEPVDDFVKLEIRPATEDQPAMVRMIGVDETQACTYEVRPGSVTFRYTPRK